MSMFYFIRSFHFLFHWTLFVPWICSCVFSLEDENFVVVSEEIKDSVFEINLNPDHQGDTIILILPTKFNFSLNVGSKQLRGVSVTFGGKGISVSGNDTNYSFEINPWSNESGIKELRIEFESSTGRDNLADKLGNEFLQGVYQFWVKLDGDLPHPISINSIYIENGQLQVQYEKYDRINFKKYRLVRIGSPGYSFETTDQNQTILADPYFIGGDAQYRMDVMIHNQDITSLGPITEYTNTSGSIISTEFGSLNEVIISWSKSPFYESFDNYSILVQYPNNNFFKSIMIYDINQSTITTNLPIGSDIRLVSVVNPNNQFSFLANLGYLQISVGDVLDFKDFSLYNTQEDIFYTSESLDGFSGFAFRALDSDNNVTGQSEHPRINMGIGQIFGFEDQMIYALDPITLSDISSIDLRDILENPPVFNSTRGRAVGDNGLMAIFISYIDGSNNQTLGGYIIDFYENKVLYNSHEGLSRISGTGNYYVKNDSLYQYMSPNKIYIDFFETCECEYYFPMIDGLEYLAIAKRIADDKILSLYELPSLTLVEDRATEGLHLSIDPYKPYYGFARNDTFYVYQFGMEEAVISLESQPSGGLNNGYLINDDRKIKIY